MDSCRKPSVTQGDREHWRRKGVCPKHDAAAIAEALPFLWLFAVDREAIFAKDRLAQGGVKFLARQTEGK